MFIRVKDKRTGHQYDVHEQAFDPAKHEEIKRVPRSKVARPAKPQVKAPRKPAAKAAEKAAPKTSAKKAVEGVSPAGE